MSTSASNVMLVTSTSNFTPDEKRDLLFNINCTLEIPMDDFNENWWPIVLNIWTQWNSSKHTNGDVRKVLPAVLQSIGNQVHNKRKIS